MAFLKNLVGAAGTASKMAAGALAGAPQGPGPAALGAIRGGITSAKGPVPPASSLENARLQNRQRMAQQYGYFSGG